MNKLVWSRNITRVLARVAVDAAVGKSTELGVCVSIAVVDSAGHLVCFERMDSAPFQTAKIAVDKAYSVAGNGMATHEFWEVVRQEEALLHGVATIEGATIIGGGLPVLHDGELIGAVGISGKSSMNQDREIAEAAVEAVAACLAP
ncbi:heme-binding protein [Arthrobacter sp. M-10]|uniref:GlcG/HbpS family heme-binding protein n=1 Tax=Arthrobacter sp. M-10 TaxID=3233037 RepID=UPI003F934DD8